MTTPQHPLALKPLYFPALVTLNPAEHYNGGIPIRAVEDDLQGIIPAWFNMSIGDKAEVFWGNANSAIWSKTLDLDIELNKDLSFTIPKAHVLDGEAKPVFYRITYKNQTSEDSKPELVLLVKLTRPGEYDDIAGDDGHSDLKFSLDHDEVDQNLPTKGVTMRIVPYRNLTRYDRILARWGSQQVTHVVTPEQALDPVRHPIDVVFSRAVIETAGDGPEVAVAYQVVDRCGNYPDERAPWSAIRKVLVDLGGNRLKEPFVLVKGQPTNSINLDQLGDDDVEVLVNTPEADFKVGDKVFLTWTGTPAQGSQIIVGPLELPVAVVSFPLKFPIPNASVRAIAKGSASVGYICQRSGAADRPSKNASVPVIGEISQLRAPTVDEAPGGTLPPETPLATVNIPWYPGRNSSDLINLIWQAQAPGGSTVYYEDPRPVGDIAENQPVQRNVSNAEIRRFNGLNVKVFYTVTNSETALLSVRESLVFPMQVGVPLPTFDRPEVEGADNDVLDPDKVPPLGATLVVPYLGTRDKDRVTWRGSASGGSTSDHVDLIPATAGKPVRITVAKQYVTANLNGTVVADYSIQRAGATVGNSHELTLRIGAALDLDAPKIKEANGSTSLNPFAAKDSLTAIVDYTGMAIGDDIIVTWTGTTPNGSDTSAKKTVTTLGPQSITLKNAVVAFNLGKAVTVSYTVTRGGAPVPSKVLPLTVLTIPHEHAELPKATIDGASNDDLDVITLANNASTRVAAWPLIAANQKIWLRYSGTKADGSEYKKTTYEGETLRGNGVIVGPYPATPVAELRGLKDNSTLKIEFKVTFDGSTDEAKAVTFPSRVYNVKAVQDVKPVISTVQDFKGEDIPNYGGTVDPKIKLTGTAAPLQEVEVFDIGTSKGKYTANDAGIWTCETTLTGIGSRTLTAKALYGTGQVSLGRVVTLSNAIKPSITSVKDSKGVEIPDKGTTPDTTVTLTGGGTPRLKVQIFDGVTSKGIAEVGASNGRWELEVTGLSLAEHSFTAKALYGSGLESDIRELQVVAQVTPSIDNVTDSKGPVWQGGITFDRSVTVTGKASPNQKVRLRDGTNTLHEPTANGSGVWTQVVSGLAVKGYSLTALALYGDGSESTPPRTFTVAQAGAPSIDNVTDSKGPVLQGGITFDRNVTVTGTASPNQKVRLRDGTNALHEPTANGSGVWTQVVSGLAVKGYSLTVLALYGDGPGSTPPRTFTVAQAVTPTITNVTDSKGPVVQGGITFDRNVTVTGTASPNQKVRLRDGTNALHEPTANGSGVWTQVVSGLAVKGYSLTALALYGDGPGSTPPRTFTVAQAVTPTITNVTDSKGPVVQGGITFDRNVTVTGTASPNQKVRLRDGTNALHEPTANGSGVWTQVVSGLAVKGYSLTALALYGDGPGSTPPRTFNVAQAGVPTITNVTDSKGPVLQGGITFDRSVTVTGTASPNQKVRLRDGTNTLHEPTANASGVWTQVVSALTVKAYSLTALALYGDGPESTPPRTFTVAQAVTPTITNITDSKGTVAPGGITFDRTVTVTGTASPNQKVRLLDGSTALHEPTANGSGVWTQVVTGLSVATHSFKAKALYGSGEESAVRTLIVTEATAPTLTSVKGSPSGKEIPENGTTEERAVTLTGIGAKGQKVRVLDGSTIKDDVTVDPTSGIWELKVTGLSVDTHSFKAKALYGTGEESLTRNFRVLSAFVLDEKSLTLSGLTLKLINYPFPESRWDNFTGQPEGTDDVRQLTGGYPPYTLHSGNEDVAYVKLNRQLEGSIVVRSVGNGTTTITVTDAYKRSRTFNVTVKNAQKLLFSSQPMDIAAAINWKNSLGARLLKDNNHMSILQYTYRPTDLTLIWACEPHNNGTVAVLKGWDLTRYATLGPHYAACIVDW